MEKYGSMGGVEGWLRKGITRRIRGVDTASRRKKDFKKCVRGSNVCFYTQQSGPANSWECSAALQWCVEEGCFLYCPLWTTDSNLFITLWGP